MEKPLDFYSVLDLLEELTLTVFDDRDLFDGASTRTVHEHFRQWAADTWRQDRLSQGEDNDDDDTSLRRKGISRSQRCKSAVQVATDHCVQSFTMRLLFQQGTLLGKYGSK
ncbi:hypothetical protein K431DRAFT_343182 [Polychaeton citri CBS 116435]|uniref:Uncharacterized protein n=1 Tax=Polychaeton citri CBS 116435 TaxID=1314669 RepID=A0A9P4QHX3_9PEZI|nr:hypothetical protein K431DRAFT_343182 [Polychaeton citri CBS 116435]